MGNFAEITGSYSCVNVETNTYFDASEPDPDYMNISFTALVALPIIYIWEKIDAGKEVTKYNNKLYKSIFGKEPPSFSLNLQPTYQGANFTMSYAFN